MDTPNTPNTPETPRRSNLPTYVALYDYGYRNVYELGPLLEVATTRIEFERSR